MFQQALNFNNGGTGSIDNWQINTGSNVNMSSMFNAAVNFNQPIGSWNTSRVINMSSMFSNANSFNQDIGSWDTSNVTGNGMISMFFGADVFNNGGTGSIDSWDTSNVTSFSQMFYDTVAFNQPIGSWNTSNITSTYRMFRNAQAFNQDVGSWDVSSVTDFRETFEDALDFNNGGTGSINSWQINTSSAGGVNMNSMFYDARRFNQPIGSWDMSNVIDVFAMFTLTEDFNQDIGSWDMSNLTSLNSMFSSAQGFNNGGTGSIDSWNTSNVTIMDAMFYIATSFNQNIGSWDVSRVTSMLRMFRNATNFNNSGSDSIRNWDTSNVTTIQEMFFGPCAFDQPLDGWDISSITNATNFMNNSSGLSTTNYDLTLVGWGAQSGSVNSGVNINFGSSTYTSGSLADSRRQDLINAGWIITDGGYAP